MTWTTPPTKATGDPILASDFNLYVQGNTKWLAGLDNSWSTPSFVNSWAASSSYPAYIPGYRRFGNVVRLRGSIAGGSPGTTAFALPGGYLPPQTVQQVSTLTGTPGIVLIEITNAGDVLPAGSFSAGTSVSLDGVDFPIM